MKKFVLFAVALALAVTAAPAFASVQNVKVYGNVDSTYLHRNNMSFNAGGDEQRQATFFTQTRLGIDADLTDNVAVTVGLLNERVWGADNGVDGFNGNGTDAGSDTAVDIYLAYVTLREMLYSPLTLVVGRQQWGYGSGLVFDATGQNNVAPSDSNIQHVANDFTYQTSLDAIRAILDYNPLTVELFYSLVDHGSAPAIGSDTAGDDKELFGVYTTYALGDDMDSVVEAYFFDEKDDTGTEDASHKVVGLRASTNPLEGVATSVEFAKEAGYQSNDDSRTGYIFQFATSYAIPVAEEFSPVLSYEFTKASGDGNANDDEDAAWSGFYEAQDFGTLYNSIFNLSNLEIHTVALEVSPLEDVSTKLSWHGLWKEKEVASLSFGAPYGTTPTPALKANEDEVGQEVDLDVVYQYTEDVTIAANYGIFFPGDVFTNENDTTAKQAYITLGVAF